MSTSVTVSFHMPQGGRVRSVALEYIASFEHHLTDEERLGAIETRPHPGWKFLSCLKGGEAVSLERIEGFIDLLGLVISRHAIELSDLEAERGLMVAKAPEGINRDMTAKGYDGLIDAKKSLQKRLELIAPRFIDALEEDGMPADLVNRLRSRIQAARPSA